MTAERIETGAWRHPVAIADWRASGLSVTDAWRTSGSTTKKYAPKRMSVCAELPSICCVAAARLSHCKIPEGRDGELR